MSDWQRRRRKRALALVPSARRSASAKVELGLRLRSEATLTGRCACGAKREAFEVLSNGSLVPTAEPNLAPGTVTFIRFEHEHDCPAASPELERAYERGEISDPGGDLLRGLQESGSA